MEGQLKRLTTDDYERPKQTIQDKMTDIEIKEKLKNYTKVESIMNLDIGTHVRYFANINGDMKYRSGGNIIKKDSEGRYVVLSNGKVSWSASTATCIFYRELSVDDIRKIHKKEIEDYDKKLAQQKSTIKSLKKELMRYKNV